MDAAKDLSTGIEELAELSKSEYGFVKAAVAENPNTTSEILENLLPEKISVEEDFFILSSISKNSAVSADLADKIVQRLLECIQNISPRDYYSKMAVENLFRNTAIPFNSLCRLLCSNNFPKFLKLKIASVDSRKDILQFLANDRSEKVRQRVKKHLSNSTENA